MNPSIRFLPLPTIGELLKLYKLGAIKALSQNFLLNLQVTDKIVRVAKNIENGEVCEVGPGPGGITRSILKNKPKRVIVIEKDPRFKPMLEGLAESVNCEMNILYCDIMSYDMSETFDKSLKKDWRDSPPNIHLIGNLPFSVSTPLIIQWMKDISLRRSAWSYGRVKMTLTFQEEVAERMTAPILSKKRCRMSVMCQNWCKVTHNFTIPGKAFLPKPKVNVGVVHLVPLVEPIINMDFHLIEKVIRTIFNSRQKHSYNTAQRLFPTELRKKLTNDLFELAELNPTVRSFQITNEEFGRLCRAYKKICDEDPRLYSYNYREKKEVREEIWKAEEEEEEDGDDDYDNDEAKEEKKEEFSLIK